MSEDEQIIPASDYISRHTFFPIMFDSEQKLIWENVFIFQQKYSYCESVVWRKYATLVKVHKLGCIKAERDRIIRSNRKYKGAYTGNVGAVQNVICTDNISINVEHDPGNGQGIQHAHLRVVLPEGVEKLLKNRRVELWARLKEVFLIFDSYP